MTTALCGRFPGGSLARPANSAYSRLCSGRVPRASVSWGGTNPRPADPLGTGVRRRHTSRRLRLVTFGPERGTERHLAVRRRTPAGQQSRRCASGVGLRASQTMRFTHPTSGSVGDPRFGRMHVAPMSGTKGPCHSRQRGAGERRVFLSTRCLNPAARTWRSGRDPLTQSRGRDGMSRGAGLWAVATAPIHPSRGATT